MKQIISTIGLFFIVACNDSNSSSAILESADNDISSSSVEITFEESSSSILVPQSSSSISYGIVPVTNPLIGDSQNIGNGIGGNITSSSMTEYNFHTERTILYSTYTPVHVGIVAFYDENGVMVVASDENGYYYETIRLQMLEEQRFAIWLWSNNHYKHDTCPRDRSLFKEKCESLIGEYMDYAGKKSCSASSGLQLSCVFPIWSQLSDKDLIDSLAFVEKDFAEKYWNVPSKNTIVEENSTGTFDSDFYIPKEE